MRYAIDWTKYCPNVLCIEVSAMTTDQSAEVRSVLAQHGLRVAHKPGAFTTVFARG